MPVNAKRMVIWGKRRHNLFFFIDLKLGIPWVALSPVPKPSNSRKHKSPKAYIQWINGGKPLPWLFQCIQLILPAPIFCLANIKEDMRGQMSYQDKSAVIRVFYEWHYICINILCGQDIKNPDILLSVQGKCSLPLHGRCFSPLEKTSWGLKKERGVSKDWRIAPHHPLWMHPYKPLWHLRKLIFTQGQLRWLLCNAEADGSWLSSPGGRTRGQFKSNSMYYLWRRTDWKEVRQKRKPQRKKEELGVVCGLASSCWCGTWQPAMGSNCGKGV